MNAGYRCGVVIHDNSLPLSQITTLRVGGPAKNFIRCTDADSLIETVADLDAAGTPVLLVGGGSNLVISDDGFDGTVVQIANTETDWRSDHVTAGAGVNWDDLVAESIERGFGGLECLSGIPGAAGATPVQNVGAYGVEVGSLLRSVQILDRRSGGLNWVDAGDLELGYRTSRLKRRNDELVVRVSFRLHEDGLSEPIRYRELAGALDVAEGERAPAADVRAAVLALRSGKGMVLDADDHDTWSVGSFFTNPIVPQEHLPTVLTRIVEELGAEATVPQFPADLGVKLSAGWLIERAGFARGFPDSGAPARLSTKHSLAITNRGEARAEDIVELAKRVRDGVHERFGLWLEPEPVLVGCTL
ncbi:UDP-N-acetylenolpyruvoylglucosamine reductase [Williamsia sp. 1138]|uniref:UDP-N-acetylmuramate dehydrogenase n=1 Tax=Williamsia sp. 1138 TaxID=1903117 RepID=UPI000B9A305A|nr:UDP-N-acetylmuramate dehydrogenase [Williamsia sp. 1138]OZG30164.1 UDP-N-acetylenolpyruvoylglucosamine reductase [Williamsia sp. 1138]